MDARHKPVCVTVISRIGAILRRHVRLYPCRSGIGIRYDQDRGIGLPVGITGRGRAAIGHWCIDIVRGVTIVPRYRGPAVDTARPVPRSAPHRNGLCRALLH